MYIIYEIHVRLNLVSSHCALSEIWLFKLLIFQLKLKLLRLQYLKCIHAMCMCAHPYTSLRAFYCIPRGKNANYRNCLQLLFLLVSSTFISIVTLCVSVRYGLPPIDFQKPTRTMQLSLGCRFMSGGSFHFIRSMVNIS